MSAAASTLIAASSIWAPDRNCSAPSSPSPIPSTAPSTRSTSAPTVGATIRTPRFHLDAKKAKLYDFNADYRDIAYFNYLPSYADPLLSRGIVLNEQSFDTRRRFASFTLDLLPGNWIVPYFAYDRDSGSGTGATTFVSDGNEYPGAEPAARSDQSLSRRRALRAAPVSRHARAGRHHVQRRPERVSNPGSTNYGNVLTPVFGQTLDLTSLLASLRIRGTSIYSKGLFTASATSWLDLYGQFLYSQPDSDVHYQQTDTGNLFLAEPAAVLHQPAVSAFGRREAAAHHGSSARKSGRSAACGSSNRG